MTPLRRGTANAGGCLIRFDHWKRIFPVRNPGPGPVSRRSRHAGAPRHHGYGRLRRGPSSRVAGSHRLMCAPVLTQGSAWRSCHRAFLTEAGLVARGSSGCSYTRLSTRSSSISLATDPPGTVDPTHARFTVRCVHGTAGERRMGKRLGGCQVSASGHLGSVPAQASFPPPE